MQFKNKHALILLLLLLLAALSPAQYNVNWSPLGPYGKVTTDGERLGMARIHHIVKIPGTNDLLAGTGRAGLWKCTAFDDDPTTGSTWTCLTDDVWAMGVHAIGVTPADPDLIYIGNSGQLGADHAWARNHIQLSTDAGATWQDRPLADGATPIAHTIEIMEILVSPNDGAKVYVATTHGLFYSGDFGQNWDRLYAGANPFDKAVYGLVQHPGDVNAVYFMHRNGGTAEIYRIDSAWNTAFRQQTLLQAFPNRNAHALAVTQAAPAYLYAVLNDPSKTINPNANYYEIKVTEDAAAASISFSDIPLTGYSGSGPGYIAVSQTDPEVLIGGTVGAFTFFPNRATPAKWDGSWQHNTGVHVDPRHAIAYDENGTNAFYHANDGGVYFSTDDGSTWHDITYGIGGTEFWFHAGASFQNEDIMIGGTMHNGSVSLYRWKDPNGDYRWYQPGGGDLLSGVVTIRDVVLYRFGTHKKSRDGIAFTDMNMRKVEFYRGSPFYAYGIDTPHNLLHRSTDEGATWTKIIPSGPAPFDISSKEKIIRVAPSDSNYIYVLLATVNNSVWRSADGGVTWSDITPSGIAGKPVDLKIDFDDPCTAWLVVGADRVANGNVYRIDGCAGSFQDYSAGLTNPYPNLSHYAGVKGRCIEPWYGSDGGVFLGTEEGIWYRDNQLINWVPYNRLNPAMNQSCAGDLPMPTPISDLEIFYGTNKLRAFTFGRGVWETPLHTLPDPKAQIAVDHFTVRAGDSLQFYDYSCAYKVQSYAWTFSCADVSEATDRNPKVVFYTPGTAQVSLTVTDSLGRQSTALVTVEVRGAPAPVVTNENEFGPGSFRDAVHRACPGAVIRFAPEVSNVILDSAVFIKKDLTIEGHGRDLLTLRNRWVVGWKNVLTIDAGATVTIRDLTIRDGRSYVSGSNIRLLNGTLYLERCTVENGFVKWYGGGICAYYSYSNLYLTDCIVRDNISETAGGGIYAAGYLHIQNSTISGNSLKALKKGGGIYLKSTATAELSNVTLTGNSGDRGAGIYNDGGTVYVAHATITGNNADHSGGGLWNAGNFSIVNSIVHGNTVGATIPADVYHSSPFYSPAVNGAYSNMIGVAGLSGSGFDASELGIDPQFAALADNGGPTPTHNIACGPAVDAGFTANDLLQEAPALIALVAKSDQRGWPRSLNPDVGAVERAGSVQTVTSAADDGSAGTLRSIVGGACSGDTLTFAAGITAITLTTELAIDKDLVLQGPGAEFLTLKGEFSGSYNRAIYVHDGARLAVRKVRVADSRSHSSGALMRVQEAILEVDSCILEGGFVHWNGGALFAWGDGNELILRNSIVRDNDAPYYGDGGGVYVSGKYAISNCLFEGNSARGGEDGGGLYVASGATGSVVNCTFSGNEGTLGGGLYNGGTLHLVNVTLTENDAFTHGGGLYNAGTCTAVNNIVYGNSQGATAEDIYHATAVNSPSVQGNYSNRIGVSALAGSGFDASEFGADPGLSPLTDHGGFSHTHMPSACGGVTDAGFSAALLEPVNPLVSKLIATTDQRGFDRVGRPDLGAAESARTLLVTNDSDDTGNPGPGSLRHAIRNACDGDTIRFDLPGSAPWTIDWLGKEIIRQSVTLKGPGIDQLTIDGNNTHNFFQTDSINLTLRLAGIRFVNGKTTYSGGGIPHVKGHLEVASCHFENCHNTWYDGGAIRVYPGATAEIQNTTFVNNRGAYKGGALKIDGIAVIRNCAFVSNGNSSTDDGAAIWVGYEALIENCTFSGNGSGGLDLGGALVNTGKTTAVNCTFFGNEANTAGGAIHNQNELYLLNCILYDNTVNGQMRDLSESGTYARGQSLGGNLLGDVTDAPAFQLNGDVLGQDPELSASLTDPGVAGPGETPYHAFTNPSNPPAFVLNGVTPAVHSLVPQTDQRMVDRENATWMGSYQYSATIGSKQAPGAPMRGELRPEFRLRAFPNPVQGTQVGVSIQGNAQHQSTELYVSDVQGKRLLSSNLAAGQSQGSLQIPDLPAGIYVLSATQGEAHAATKFVVLR